MQTIDVSPRQIEGFTRRADLLREIGISPATLNRWIRLIKANDLDKRFGYKGYGLAFDDVQVSALKTVQMYRNNGLSYAQIGKLIVQKGV